MIVEWRTLRPQAARAPLDPDWDLYRCLKMDMKGPTPEGSVGEEEHVENGKKPSVGKV